MFGNPCSGEVCSKCDEQLSFQKGHEMRFLQNFLHDFIKPPFWTPASVHGAGGKNAHGLAQKTVDFSNCICYPVNHEPETRLPVSMVSHRRAEADTCSHLWLCAVRLQLGTQTPHRCLLPGAETHLLQRHLGQA